MKYFFEAHRTAALHRRVPVAAAAPDRALLLALRPAVPVALLGALATEDVNVVVAKAPMEPEGTTLKKKNGIKKGKENAKEIATRTRKKAAMPLATNQNPRDVPGKLQTSTNNQIQLYDTLSSL